eukprot:CAMPEP_0119026586 /NCGR_PEP_ID=MMETSP1176-20130426/35728_1 /TAXON_ID=265551 /ORGANISM="Synedropsis recta cf, Strain CCMP1620" /LENGTH=316 /DNA_ID=CAMNT_0006982331 /DNA_START=20 /DNA_END=970 /DNA_ORIENTATION=-
MTQPLMQKKATMNDYTAMRHQAPRSMTMERMGDTDEFILAQTTMLCLRHGCCRPSINWVLQDANNYEPGSSPFTLPNIGGWIHEESTFCQRCCWGGVPGCRETKFVQHAGYPPARLQQEDRSCCVIQTEPTSDELTPMDLQADVVATHEKEMTCSTGCACCFGHAPYLLTKDDTGIILGETRFVCDACLFVPKFHVLDASGSVQYLLRPDTCCGGLCVMPRCGGAKGKCCRVPFLIRSPATGEALYSNVQEGKAQVTSLWSGLFNEVCLKRRAYHVAFPVDATREERMVLTGSALLVDVAVYEQDEDNNDGGGGGG